jgi:hypothetical protein
MNGAMPEETVAHAVDRLTAAGYRDSFRAEADGLHAVPGGCLHAPESLTVDEVVRFEGVTDPGDEAIVFALRCGEHGVRGTFVIAYGTNATEQEAQMARRLRVRR